jgi:hypothetical protein
MSVITITTNTENFTFQYDNIVKDYAFNDLNYYVSVVDDRYVDITHRKTDDRQYRIDTVDDTIDVDGTTIWADASTLATALRTVFFKS